MEHKVTLAFCCQAYRYSILYRSVRRFVAWIERTIWMARRLIIITPSALLSSFGPSTFLLPWISWYYTDMYVHIHIYIDAREPIAQRWNRHRKVVGAPTSFMMPSNYSSTYSVNSFGSAQPDASGFTLLFDTFLSTLPSAILLFVNPLSPP
jgi:hypothetical protein